jgi:hypothetical protein
MPIVQRGLIVGSKCDGRFNVVLIFFQISAVHSIEERLGWREWAQIVQMDLVVWSHFRSKVPQRWNVARKEEIFLVPEPYASSRASLRASGEFTENRNRPEDRRDSRAGRVAERTPEPDRRGNSNPHSKLHSGRTPRSSPRPGTSSYRRTAILRFA